MLTRLMPAALWLGTIGAAAMLYTDVGNRGPILGFAHGVKTKVSTEFSGRIRSLAVDIGQEVTAGQVVATLDARDIEAQELIERAELRRIEAEMRAVQARARQRTLATARGFDQAGDSARLDLARAQAELQVKQAELSAVEARRKELTGLLSRGLVVKGDLAEQELRFVRLSREVQVGRKTVKLLRTQAGAKAKRRKALPEDAVSLAMGPLVAEKAVIKNRLARLKQRRKALVLRSPMSGRISEIFERPGEVVQTGQPVVTVVSKKANRVVACVYEKQATQMRVGRRVTLFPRGWSRKTLRGHVMAVGPIVNQLPARCRPQPRQRAWGRDMFIQLDEPADLVPGLAFNVRLEGNGGLFAGKSNKPKTKPGQPVAMTVPAALRGASRFEPSGLIWVPRLARYLVVSDDTGHKKQNEHAPWLFTMTRAGKADSRPLHVEKAKKFNDLESIAMGKDGSVYVLSSQSTSKKGKRKASRQVFARLVPSGLGFRLDRMVALADLLDASGAETLRRLGIDQTRTLDIEGMTAHDGGLLLGLKAPLTPQGQAIIWSMKSPEALLSSGKLADAGLSLWGTLGLKVAADGEQVEGGISDLLALPDGTLVLGATASGINPRTQDGSLWHVTRTESAGLKVRRFGLFAGLKPEGIALSPKPGKISVVFDRGDQTPSWAELPWPK